MPYKGTAPAVTDLLAGNVDLMFNELASSIELHKSGRARILAVTVNHHVAALPDIPTLEEAGVSGCDSDTWHALTAPPKTPDDVVAKLNAAANKAMQDARSTGAFFAAQHQSRAADRPRRPQPSSSRRRRAGAT